MIGHARKDDIKCMPSVKKILAVFKIYSFVTTHLNYGVQDGEKGALWALKNAVGDCSEYSHLFVVLY